MTSSTPSRWGLALGWGLGMVVLAALVSVALEALGPRPPTDPSALAGSSAGREEALPSSAGAGARGRLPSPAPRSEPSAAPQAAAGAVPSGGDRLARQPPAGGDVPPPLPAVELREEDFTPCEAGKLAGVFDPSEASRVCERFREAEEALLTQRAVEGGRLDPEEAAATWEQLHDALGDAGYAAALYAVGRPNRLTLGEGPGDPLPAGLERGDVLHAVDGRRVFSRAELMRRLEQGAGAVVVLRDGERVEIDPQAVSGDLPWEASSVPPEETGEED